MNNNEYFEKASILLYHKQATSAKTVFFQTADQRVCLFEPFPANSKVQDPDQADPPLVLHPSPLIVDIEYWLHLDKGSLLADTEYTEYVETPGGLVTVFLARFTHTDPPVDLIRSRGCRFISITEARELPPVELELLRRAYTCILG